MVPITPVLPPPNAKSHCRNSEGFPQECPQQIPQKSPHVQVANDLLAQVYQGMQAPHDSPIGEKGAPSTTRSPSGQGASRRCRPRTHAPISRSRVAHGQGPAAPARPGRASAVTPWAPQQADRAIRPSQSGKGNILPSLHPLHLAGDSRCRLTYRYGLTPAALVPVLIDSCGILQQGLGLRARDQEQYGISKLSARILKPSLAPLPHAKLPSTHIPLAILTATVTGLLFGGSGAWISQLWNETGSSARHSFTGSSIAADASEIGFGTHEPSTSTRSSPPTPGR
jgi:hypothetical protein